MEKRRFMEVITSGETQNDLLVPSGLRRFRLITAAAGSCSAQAVVLESQREILSWKKLT